MVLTSIGSPFYSWIERQSSKKSYPIIFTIILVCVGLFLAFPRYDLYNATPQPWSVTMLKAKDLTNNLNFIPPESFMAKKVFRLTVPVFIRLFHLDREEVLIVQAIMGFLFIFFSYKLAYRILKDAPSASLVAAGLVFIYAGKACFTDILFTHFDGWAYFFILLTLYSRNPLLVFVFATLAAWVDERGALALMLPILFHQMDAAKDRNFSPRLLIRPTIPTIGVLAALAAYITVRLYLSHTFQMHITSRDAGLSVLGRNVYHTSYWFGAFTFLEGFWLLVPPVLVLALRNRHLMTLTMVMGTLLLYCLAAFCVFDLTRSGSYLVPMIFVLLLYLKQTTDISFIRPLTAVCFFFSFIFPSMNYVALEDFLFYVDKPLPEVIVAMLRHS